MERNPPGKAYRKGLTLLEIADMFRNESAAKKWLAEYRWPDGKPMFSLRTGTVMEGSNLKYHAWAVGIYLFSTNLKGISSMKLHCELGISQKAAWFMLRRLRLAFEADAGPFARPVEINETYMGGKSRNMPKHKREEPTGRGATGNTALAGAKDRATNQVSAEVGQSAEKGTLQEFVTDRTDPEATVCAADASARDGLNRKHEGRQALRRRLRPRRGVDERRGVVLEHDEARVLRQVPQDEP